MVGILRHSVDCGEDFARVHVTLPPPISTAASRDARDDSAVVDDPSLCVVSEEVANDSSSNPIRVLPNTHYFTYCGDNSGTAKNDDVLRLFTVVILA